MPKNLHLLRDYCNMTNPRSETVLHWLAKDLGFKTVFVRFDRAKGHFEAVADSFHANGTSAKQAIKNLYVKTRQSFERKLKNSTIEEVS